MRAVLLGALLALGCACGGEARLVHDQSRGIFVDEHGRCYVYMAVGVNIGLQRIKCP